jgi:hypothetical protein
LVDFVVLCCFLVIDSTVSDEKEESKEISASSGSNGILLKAAPKPPIGGRGGAGAGSRSSQANQLNRDAFTGSACSTGGYQEQGTWNNEHLPYATILVGHESARRRFDMDKQAVLSQISELEFCDLFPIVLSCQFSLCIFYARCTFIRIFRLICSTLKESSAASSSSSSSPGGGTSSKGGAHQPASDDNAVLHVLGENFLKLLLETPADAPGGSTSMASLVNLLEICFKQGQGASNQPDKLFPSLLQVRDRCYAVLTPLPPCISFT